MNLCVCVCVCTVGQAGQQNTVVVLAPTIVGPVVGNVPVSTTCANCQRQVVTNISHETGGLTWLIFAILCFVGSVIYLPGASISMGQGGHVPPNIYEGGTYMVMSPLQYFMSDVV